MLRLALLAVLAARLWQVTAERDALAAEARSDALTGLPNRRAFEADGARELARMARSGRPLMLLMLDIDGFKAVNDRGGHAAGDRLLVALAAMLRAELRAVDLVARVGGDEFAVLLPETQSEDAALVAERLRLTATKAGVTLSVGVAGARGGEALGALLARADTALYRAKAEGRNRTAVAPDG